MIKIRQATIKDAEKIAYIKVITWKDTYKNLLDASYLSRLKVTQATIRKWEKRIVNAKNKKTFIWVALESNQIVGFLWGGESRVPKIEKLDLEIYGLYVLPQYQHQGIGKKLFLTFNNRVGNEFFLWMLKGNKSELFYEKLKCKKSKYLNPVTIGNKQYQEIAFVYKNILSG